MVRRRCILLIVVILVFSGICKFDIIELEDLQKKAIFMIFDLYSWISEQYLLVPEMIDYVMIT